MLFNASSLSGDVRVNGNGESSNDITGVKYISAEAFSGNNAIKSLTISNVETMDVRCFSEMENLETVVLAEVSKIPCECFRACKNLKTMKIYSSQEIKWGEKFEKYDDSFCPGMFGYYIDIKTYCQNLKEIFLYNAEAVESIGKAGIPDTVTLHVPAHAVEEYQKYVKCRVVAL